jgi:hypothetical protein
VVGPLKTAIAAFLVVWRFSFVLLMNNSAKAIVS